MIVNHITIFSTTEVVASEIKTTRVFKIVLAGDVKVGKTTLRLRYLGEGFRSDYLSTLGADFALKKYKSYEMQIWDLAGQSNFRSIIRHYYLGADGLVLVFDLTREDTLLNLSSWIEELYSSLDRKIPIIVVGNKVDLRDDSAESVTLEAARLHVKSLEKEFSAELNYIETSALTGENIDHAFEKLIEEMVEGLSE